MYHSLKATARQFHLYIFAFDDLSYRILKDLNLESATIISLRDFETDRLKDIKKSRSIAEYCWTCTPSVISHVIEHFNVPECTYVDSDLVFYSDPAILISELDIHKKNVLITEHRYSLLPRLYEEKRGGRFCVQFMTFRNEPSGMEVLERWRNQCLDWCFSRYEDGKFGDQKYLDEWPGIYPNVHILENHGGGLAPWNLQNYSITNENDSIMLTHKNSKEQLVFYHFQYVKPLGNGKYDIGWYLIPSEVRRLLYINYLDKIESTEKELIQIYSDYKRSLSTFRTHGFKGFFKNILKGTFHYNILEIH
ncbi:MAG: glycosyl transferase [Methanococcaceae archaeon]